QRAPNGTVGGGAIPRATADWRVELRRHRERGAVVRPQSVANHEARRCSHGVESRSGRIAGGRQRGDTPVSPAGNIFDERSLRAELMRRCFTLTVAAAAAAALLVLPRAAAGQA